MYIHLHVRCVVLIRIQSTQDATAMWSMSRSVPAEKHFDMDSYINYISLTEKNEMCCHTYVHKDYDSQFSRRIIEIIRVKRSFH